VPVQDTPIVVIRIAIGSHSIIFEEELDNEASIVITEEEQEHIDYFMLDEVAHEEEVDNEASVTIPKEEQDHIGDYIYWIKLGSGRC
jgi:hypothetical protein